MSKKSQRAAGHARTSQQTRGHLKCSEKELPLTPGVDRRLPSAERPRLGNGRTPDTPRRPSRATDRPTHGATQVVRPGIKARRTSHPGMRSRPVVACLIDHAVFLVHLNRLKNRSPLLYALPSTTWIIHRARSNTEVSVQSYRLDDTF